MDIIYLKCFHGCCCYWSLFGLQFCRFLKIKMSLNHFMIFFFYGFKLLGLQYLVTENRKYQITSPKPQQQLVGFNTKMSVTKYLLIKNEYTHLSMPLFLFCFFVVSELGK